MDWLRHRYKSVDCIEVDQQMARYLGQRMANTNVSVRCDDATGNAVP